MFVVSLILVSKSIIIKLKFQTFISQNIGSKLDEIFIKILCSWNINYNIIKVTIQSILNFLSNGEDKNKVN